VSTTPRFPSATPGRAGDLSSVMAHQPVLQRDFSVLYGTFWSHGVLDHPTKEVARLRNARITDCGY
jgi:hypothetical protein